MKATAILLVLVATGTILLGPASAAGGTDESALKIDLRPAGGPLLYLACDHGTDLVSTGCGVMSVWEETNGAPRSQLGSTLQKTGITGVYKPDLSLTP